MAGTDTNKKKLILDIISLVVSAGLLTAVFQGCRWVYCNYFAEPILQYDANSGEFSVQMDFRGITMRVYPQMEIRVDNVIFQVTHLDGYFEREMVYFKDKKAYVKKTNQGYEKKLRSHVREGILTALEESLGEAVAADIDSRLKISVSFIAGVQYQAPLGNEPKKYCIIENNGLLIDCGPDAKKIQERLYESELILKEDPDKIPMDPQIGEIIRVSAEEIGRWYVDGNQQT